MAFRIRQASPTDSPSLMHIEQTCRAAAAFLPLRQREPGHIKARNWRAWLTSAPPFDRHPTARACFVAYEHNDILGFIAVKHDSLFGGYRADIAGLFVLPRYRRLGIGRALLCRAALWLQEDGINRVTVDCYAGDPNRQFFHRMSGTVIASSDDLDPSAVITFGLSNLKELAAHAR